MKDTLLPVLTSRTQPNAIAPSERRVVKRDGISVPWDQERVVRAVALAFHDVASGGRRGPAPDGPGAHHRRPRRAHG